MNSTDCATCVAPSYVVPLPSPDDPDVLRRMQFLPKVERRLRDRHQGEDAAPRGLVTPTDYSVDEVVTVGPGGRTIVFKHIAAGYLVVHRIETKPIVSAINFCRWLVWLERQSAATAHLRRDKKRAAEAAA